MISKTEKEKIRKEMENKKQKGSGKGWERRCNYSTDYN